MTAFDMPTQGTHWVLPFASTGDAACHAAVKRLSLPHTQALMAALQAQPMAIGDAWQRNMPHERLLCGTASEDGDLPLAAMAHGVAHAPCVNIQLCHYEAGMDHVTLHPLADLSDEEDEALWQALHPLADEDGLALHRHAPGSWWASGAPLAGLRTLSLDRVAHRKLNGWQGLEVLNPTMTRLSHEAQMLFYAHPVSDARMARGLPPVNGLWLHGSGVWDGTVRQPLSLPVVALPHLRAAAWQGNWSGWAQAWASLEPWAEAALAHVNAGGPFALTLCGEAHAQTWVTAERTLRRPWWHPAAWRRPAPPPLERILHDLSPLEATP